jgi:hypothetical protein
MGGIVPLRVPMGTLTQLGTEDQLQGLLWGY